MSSINHKVIFIYVLAFVLSIDCISIQAQDFTQTVRGEVLDEITKLPLIGAEIYILDAQNLGTVTNENGQFSLSEVPVGRHNFYCRYLGYEDGLVSNFEITTGKSPFITIKLRESIENLDAVEIVARRDKAGTVNPAALVSARTFSMEEASNFAGSFNDPARMAQSFAGAATPDDESNEIVVRGNSPRGVLWRLEGLEIPNPNHYRDEGGSGGAINIIPDIILSNSDFYTGAFPAEYGNALSGVFDLNLRRGNASDHEFALQAGVLGLQAGAEGPIDKKNGSSYLLNYRYSTVSILGEIGIDFADEDEITPVFQDAAAHLYFPETPVGQVGIYGLWGRSIAGSDPIRDSAQWLYNGQRFIYDETYVTGVVGVKQNYLFKNNKSSIQTAVSFNKQADELNEYFIQDDYSDLLLDRDQYFYDSWRFKGIFKHKIKPQIHSEIGFLVDHLGFDINFGERIQGEFVNYLEDDDATQYYRAYTQFILRPSNQLTINAGFHAGYFALNEQFYPEPRLAGNLKVSEKSSISAGFGLHSKLEPISLYLARDFLEDGSTIQRNKDLELSRSMHNVIGWDYRINSHWRFKTEAYYQHLFNVPVFPTSYGGESAVNFRSGFTNQQLINVGKARNVGLEFTLEKFMQNGHFLLFTASLFDSKYKNTLDEWIDSRFNMRFASNLISGKEWSVGKSKNNRFGINGRIIFHGGTRYTPVNESESQEKGFIVLDRTQQFGEQLDNFFRLDAGIKYRKNKPKWSWVISLDLQNATNRENVFSREYRLSTNSYDYTYQLGLIPVLNFRVEL